MKYQLLILCLLLCNFGSAQVGIGTTNPDASAILDVTETTRGILIPRMTAAQKTAIVAPAQGLLVYQTNSAQGFYYFDGTAWNYLSTATLDAWSKTGNNATDDTVNFIGTTDVQDLVFKANNVEVMRIQPSGNVAIGANLDTARLYTNINDTDNTTIYGIRNYNKGTLTGNKYGIYNNVTEEGTGGRYGIFSITRQNNASNDVAYGHYNYLTSYGSGRGYAFLNYHYAIGTGESYGISNTMNLTNATTGDIYLNYHFLNVSISANNATLYGAFYDIDFNAGTRYGTYTTMDSSSAYNGDMYGDYHRFYGDGDGVVYGDYHEISGTGFGNAFGVYNVFAGNKGEKNGVYNKIDNTTSGLIYGLRNELSGNNAVVPQYGVYNNFTNNSGTNYGMYSNLSQPAASTSDVFGTFNNIPDVGAGTHYGFLANVPGDGHFGVYSINTSANGYSGYFDGRVGVTGTLLVDDHVLPITDAAYNLGSLTQRWNTVYATNGTIQTSDERLKKNIQPLHYGLKEVLQLHPVNYQWKDTNEPKIGLLAQEVQGLIKEIVKEDPGSKLLGMNYGELVPVLIKAIQEQNERIEILEKKLEQKD